jgi:hypothetical protein
MSVPLTQDVGSDNYEPFGFGDFEVSRLGTSKWKQCPVAGCHATLDEIKRPSSRSGKVRSPFVFCSAHGIRLHSGTFVYWNGSTHSDESRLRNFPIQRELARRLILGKSGKVESRRLGFEMSEDALSWNVFVGLAEAGKLKQTLEFLTGRRVHSEPQLYLWGIRVDVCGTEVTPFAPLERVRRLLEHDIGNYKTEPDIMLVVPGEMVVCIEAKFGSGNPLAHASRLKDGDKPTERDGLLQRYLIPGAVKACGVVARDGIGDHFHSQLFRNIVFASEMAGDAEWYVVNLVSSTQWALQQKDSTSHSYSSPVAAVSAFLNEDHTHRFRFQSWEQIHAELIANDSSLSTLDGYLRAKSAHFRQAFSLD